MREVEDNEQWVYGSLGIFQGIFRGNLNSDIFFRSKGFFWIFQNLGQILGSRIFFVQKKTIGW